MFFLRKNHACQPAMFNTCPQIRIKKNYVSPFLSQQATGVFFFKNDILKFEFLHWQRGMNFYSLFARHQNLAHPLFKSATSAISKIYPSETTEGIR